MLRVFTSLSLGVDLQTQRIEPATPVFTVSMWEFPKIGVPDFEVLIIRILLFRVLY